MSVSGAGGPKRAAIVTGGGTGIGRQIAEAFSQASTDCLIVGRRQERLAETVASCAGRSGAVASVCADVTDDSDRRRIVKECLKAFGRIDILVNNAGVSNWAPLLDYSQDEWRAVMATNLEAPFFLTQAVLPEMRSQGWGRIINIGSVYGSVALNNRLYPSRLPASSPGDRGPVRAVAYAASRGGLVSLTREFAVAVAPWNITVNAVRAGMVGSERGATDASDRRRLEEMTPLGRFGTPQEISNAVLFLASEGASFVTGSELVVDGGWTAW